MKNKTIVVGVSGGIAAFKSAALVSKLTQAGANVHVVMTESAQKFVTATTFQALSRNHVHTDTFHEPDSSKIAHIDIADQADLILVAPASANTIAKLANGIADNMLTTLILATKAPIVLAPAMNVNMFDHPAVQTNIATLKTYGYQFIEPGAGYLACGWIGKGRMAEPEDLVELVELFFVKPTTLAGKRILVTAGPTREALDPVRYFSNYSSGKMGYAIAEEAKKRGALVTLVTGPTALNPPKGVEVIPIQSAEELYEAVTTRFDRVDAVIKSAAVADYQPEEVLSQKRKKQASKWSVPLKRTKDTLKELGKRKNKQLLVGFAAESEQLEHYAKDKLTRKNLDLIVANNITEVGAGFDLDTNVVSIYTKDGQEKQYPQQSKKEVAAHILDELEAYAQRRDKQ
ncbi:phosphopantothenoylcysteine decarboxylase/phosphopantothenate--cysteine ligase [Alkalihalobacillus xiaoxiensis]|uniref:Coenzyme A biosynthesis bifunctional protein CoaBC n=1 Tax=Shouchella xiaoxiensis TaxID=766895 RepID=A0ABS2SPZ5_9BACI|nr:bifunctional phosphopantothenoylcysteine decarboxylase/phosphopantothenate--cysteine ligase CoaBC [Shouchella xiaoxiensis]MBM7837591.1 phosphopantothenoylcysteine decarboxylase/phosphopantothenate--cysteine ligase [Shouchella xiaoxiensis]